jgi:hypothetical protein
MGRLKLAFNIFCYDLRMKKINKKDYLVLTGTRFIRKYVRAITNRK